MVEGLIGNVKTCRNGEEAMKLSGERLHEEGPEAEGGSCQEGLQCWVHVQRRAEWQGTRSDEVWIRPDEVSEGISENGERPRRTPSLRRGSGTSTEDQERVGGKSRPVPCPGGQMKNLFQGREGPTEALSLGVGGRGGVRMIDLCLQEWRRHWQYWGAISVPWEMENPGWYRFKRKWEETN